jgi:hypothetical protein
MEKPVLIMCSISTILKVALLGILVGIVVGFTLAGTGFPAGAGPSLPTVSRPNGR